MVRAYTYRASLPSHWWSLTARYDLLPCRSRRLRSTSWKPVSAHTMLWHTERLGSGQEALCGELCCMREKGWYIATRVWYPLSTNICTWWNLTFCSLVLVRYLYTAVCHHYSDNQDEILRHMSLLVIWVESEIEETIKRGIVIMLILCQ